ncbi:MAG: sodium:solute symporter family protein [Myxococcota bacterium]
MTGLDWLIVVGFVLYAIGSGLRARRVASRNLEEYFLAGRTLRGWQAGISMAATQFAADTPLLVTGLIATSGIFALWRLWIYAVAFLLMGFVLAPSWRRARVLTDAELSELRYSARPAAALRAIKAVYFGTIFNCTVLAMVLWAAKEIAEPFLLWDRWLPAALFDFARSVVVEVGVPFAREVGGGADLWTRSANNLISLGAIVLVTTLYSATGGLRSVVRTDVVQFGLMLLGTAFYAGWLVESIGGMSAVTEQIHSRFAAGGPGGITPEQILAFTPSRAKDATFVVMAVFALQWLVQMNADGTGYLAQRSMACRSDRDAKQAALVFTVAQILLRSLLWLPIGLGLLLVFAPDPALAPGALRAEREVTFVRGMLLLPTGARGLMFTAMLAALASTLDTHLNWGSSYWTNDLYKRFVCEAWLRRRPSDASLVWVARGANLLILAIALAIMTRLDSIQTAWQLSLLLGAGMGVSLVLRWIWWRVNAWGEIGAIAASLLLAPVLLLWVPAEAWRLLAMAIGSTATGVTASLLTAPEPAERLCAFYERARPPGYWGPVVASLGGDPADPARRLVRGLLATAVAAFSIFSLLTGVGSWLVGSSAPLWFPDALPGGVSGRSAWIACVLAAGVGLIPVWWRLGFGNREASD